jgi:chromosomal replication initiation ATPase DnaA
MSIKIIEHLDNQFKDKNYKDDSKCIKEKENENNENHLNYRETRQDRKRELKELFNSYGETYKNIEYCLGDLNCNNNKTNKTNKNNDKIKNESSLHPQYTRYNFMYSSTSSEDKSQKDNQCKLNSNSPISVSNNCLLFTMQPPKSLLNPLSFYPPSEEAFLNEFQKQLSNIILKSHHGDKNKDKRMFDENKYNDNEIPIIEKKHIDVEINSLQDLINMIHDNPITDNVEYNIDMKMMYNIKPHLIELNDMIGMKSLKDSVVDQIIYFSQGLHKSSNKNDGDFMHTVIYGPPGTGKTEVSKILGNIYSKLGILTKNTFRKVTRADLIAGYLGQTAIKTKDVINSCIGGVLFIDEAYSLGNEEKRDSFSKECIDTLCESLSDHKDKLMVIIAGYEKELENCFFNLNQGLNSRFPWRFKIEKYTPSELKDIFTNKIIKNEWSVQNSENSIIEQEWFEKHISYFKYYGRDMETLFSKTKIAHAKRVFCKPIHDKKILTIDDINKGFEMFLLNEEVNNRNKEKNNISQSFIYL